MNFIKQLFAIESKPKRGLMALEWVVLAYTLLTLCVALFAAFKENFKFSFYGQKLRSI